jgi:hypothetical protein
MRPESLYTVAFTAPEAQGVEVRVEGRGFLLAEGRPTGRPGPLACGRRARAREAGADPTRSHGRYGACRWSQVRPAATDGPR